MDRFASGGQTERQFQARRGADGQTVTGKLSGAWCHVTSRGNERKAIFRDDSEWEHFLELLSRMTGV